MLKPLTLLAVFMLLAGECFGEQWGCHEHNLKGISGKCVEDITYKELIKYLEKLESIKS